jgi:hypothetical protein
LQKIVDILDEANDPMVLSQAIGSVVSLGLEGEHMCYIIARVRLLVLIDVVKLDSSLCLIALKICTFLAQWFLRRFSNDPTRILHFCDYISFEKEVALYLKKHQFTSMRMFCTKFD